MMIDFTPLARPWFARRVRAVDLWRRDGSAGLRRVQTQLLRSILQRSRGTYADIRLGTHSLAGLPDAELYARFRDKVPVTVYDDIEPIVNTCLRKDATNVFWPGPLRSFAQSSGTSGKSKYIPITRQGLRENHYAGASTALAFYLDLNQHSRIFSGKSLILGGSFANEVKDLYPGVRVGDLSATLIHDINPVVELFRVPSRKVALMENWDEKLPAIVEAALKADITNISGVPSWFMTVIEKVIVAAGASTIHDVWPNLEVFFHGGIAFGPYREQYARLTDPAKMHYIENYNASEGFFAAQDTNDPSAGMLLLLDVGVFYEFNPPGSPLETIPTWAVKEGEVYEMRITSVNGLWRYSPGDTVRIVSAQPLRVEVAGRTRCFINAFGEELMVHNAEAAMAAACARTGAQVRDYSAAPVYATADGKRGHHQWLVEWVREPDSLGHFAAELDKALAEVNSDYQAKRSGGIFLDPPEITTARPGLFNAWLASTGKLGGQRKVPRLANDRTIMNKLLELNQ